VKKDDDVYEMAIQYKKEEDFSGWYTDVSSFLHTSLEIADRIVGPHKGSDAGLL
jgi:hypothetical protein